MDRWSELETFVQVADLGSFSKAADALNMSVSAVSRSLSALEQRLTVRLVQRTTRRLRLTTEGEQFLVRCRDLLSSLREAELSVSEHALSPTGLLRVSASLSFCLLHLTPAVEDFTRRYPEVTVEIIASNRYHDLIENGVDVAIRTRRIESDSTTTLRRLAETRRLVAASPDYLSRYGVPVHPSDLGQHRLLLYTLADNWNEMHFHKDGEQVVVPVSGLLKSDDGQVLRAAAVNGMGILFQPTYIIADDLKKGRLVRVLDDWHLSRLTMSIAYPSRSNLPSRTRLFIDYLVKTFEEHGYEREWTR